jgi:hypothetical protein
VTATISAASSFDRAFEVVIGSPLRQSRPSILVITRYSNNSTCVQARQPIILSLLGIVVLGSDQDHEVSRWGDR